MRQRALLDGLPVVYFYMRDYRDGIGVQENEEMRFPKSHKNCGEDEV
jgi:hypothetical protein